MENDGSHSEPPRSHDVGVLGKALDLLESLAEDGEQGLSALRARTGVNKASVYRVLSTLERRGYVSKDPISRKYRLGSRLLALTSAFVSGLHLIREARPILEGLHAEFDETVNLGVLSEGHVLYLDMLESRRGLRMAARVGKRDPAYGTALGKAILSRLPAEARDRLFAAIRFERQTPRTITTREALERELAVVRERGYAIDDEENERGARCVAVPILDGRGWPLAAVSVSGPASRLTHPIMKRIGKRLSLAVREIAKRMGYEAALQENEGAAVRRTRPRRWKATACG